MDKALERRFDIIRRNKSPKRKQSILGKGNDVNASMEPKCTFNVEYVVYIGYRVGFFFLNSRIFGSNTLEPN